MLRYLFLLLLSYGFATQAVRSQNLIFNPRFEQLNQCCEYRISCAPAGWWTASGSTFNFEPVRYDKDRRPIPVPAPLTMGYSDIPGFRTYIQAPLLCPLDQDSLYLLEIKVRERNYRFGSLGILFSDTFIDDTVRYSILVDSTTGLFTRVLMDTFLTLPPDTLFPLREALPQGSFRVIRYVYRARGPERFLVFGNFDPEENFQKRKFRKATERKILDIQEVSLSTLSGRDICFTDPQVALVNRMNRRHSFYGTCLDRQKRNMDSLFFGIAAWAQYYQQDSSQFFREETPLNKPIVLPFIRFDFDKATLLPESFPGLDSLLKVLLMHPEWNIELLGHTDSFGSPEYNRQLALNRVKAVTVYLIQKGLEPDRIQFRGLGSSQPLLPNNNEENRAVNRRVEIILREREAGTP